MLTPARQHILQADGGRLPLADGSMSMTFTSPPYIDARTYGISAQRKCGEWVEWMLGIVREMNRVTRGLVLVNCAGVTRNKCYQPGPEGLCWEWWKAGGNLWRPAYWHRVGIPGSGGKQWLRADIEYVLAFTRDSEWLPWADNTANGHPPKYAAGGGFTHMTTDGIRVDRERPEWLGGRNLLAPYGGAVSRQHEDGIARKVWGNRGAAGGRRADGTPKKPHMRATRDTSSTGEQLPNRETDFPVLANPGNLVTTQWDVGVVFDIISLYGNAAKIRPSEVLRELQKAACTSSISRWFIGVVLRLRSEEILRTEVHGDVNEGTGEHQLRSMWDRFSSEEFGNQILQSSVCRERKGQATGEGGCNSKQPIKGKSDPAQNHLYGMLVENPTTGAPQGWQPAQQQSGEPYSTLSAMSHKSSQESNADVLFVRETCEEIQGLRNALRQALPEIQAAWGSVEGLLFSAISEGDHGSYLVKVSVGGGHMGHPLAHRNEAPFPVKLAEWFIRSWCPPGGWVLDCFAGSGTVAQAAANLGRNAIVSDIRWNQCELMRERLSTPYTPKAKREKRVIEHPHQQQLFAEVPE